MPARISRSSSGEVGAVAAVRDRAVVDLEQLLLELHVARIELAGAEVLRVVAPVAVGADPDLEQRRLVLGDRAVARRGERLDARAPTRRASSRARSRPCPRTRCRSRARRPPTPRPPRASVMPGWRLSCTRSSASAASSFARRIRSISCSVLIARACARSGARVDAVRERLEERAPSASSARRACGPPSACPGSARGRCARGRARGTPSARARERAPSADADRVSS